MADPTPRDKATNGAAHAEHDPELIAALLDTELPEAERARALERTAACPECATLHADLLALATANRDLRTPARPRDFTLTAADAVRRRQPAREPVAARARLTGEMTDIIARHDAHDRLLIANLVDRSVSEAERARGDALLAACRACATLYADLIALAEATRTLPVPARARDFTLTAADAERLRVRGWRRLLGLIGSPRDALTRPLAMGLTTLGIAGLLVTTIPAAFSGMAASPTSLSPIGEAVGDAAGGAGGASVANPEMAASSGAPPGLESGPAAIAAAPSETPAPAEDPAAEASGAARQDEPDKLFVGGESSPPAGEPAGDDANLYRTTVNDAPGPSAALLLASLLLVAGLGLFGLRWTARRLGDG